MSPTYMTQETPMKTFYGSVDYTSGDTVVRIVHNLGSTCLSSVTVWRSTLNDFGGVKKDLVMAGVTVTSPDTVDVEFAAGALANGMHYEVGIVAA